MARAAVVSGIEWSLCRAAQRFIERSKRGVGKVLVMASLLLSYLTALDHMNIMIEARLR